MLNNMPTLVERDSKADFLSKKSSLDLLPNKSSSIDSCSF